MRLPLLLGALALVATACTQSTAVPQSSGSIGVSEKDALLFVADPDHDRVVIIDTATRQVVGRTDVGKRPERIFVASTGAVYVTSRGARSVSRLSADGLHVEASATVGAEPVGMTLTSDGAHLLVANSMSGSLSALNPVTLEVQTTVDIGGRPWALATAPDNRRIYVTDFADGTVRIFDLDRQTIVGTLTLEQPTQAECAWGEVPQRTPAQAADVIISPDGTRAYVAHVQSRTGTADGFQRSLRLAVAPALSTVETNGDRVRLDSAPQPVGSRRDGITDGTSTNAPFPPAILSTNLDEGCTEVGGGTGMDAPSSLVVDGLGEWIFVADHNSNAVAVVSATRRTDERFRIPNRGIADVVRVGAKPTGIAVAGNLRTAWVHNALDYSVSVVKSVDGRLQEEATIFFDQSPLPAEVERGRRLFYSAVDERMTQPEFGGVSCSSCHPDGRADALTWVLPDPSARTSNRWDTGGQALPPRNTPPLWGVGATAPYHWDGALADLPAFNNRMVRQMGGMGLMTRDVADLSSYLNTIELPDNPRLGATAPALVARGEQLFNDRCQSCHAGAALTDGQPHPTARSGLPAMLDTPSLRGAFASGPYLHNGAAPSIRAVLEDRRPSVSAHDQRQLAPADREALEAFVLTR